MIAWATTRRGTGVSHVCNRRRSVRGIWRRQLRLPSDGSEQLWLRHYDRWEYPNFRIGCSVGGNRYGVFAYAGAGADDGNTTGPATNAYTNNAGVLGTSLQFTGVAGTTDALQP